MRHTYLFEEGRWNAHGNFTNEQGETLAVAGESVITHKENFWWVESTMTLSSDPEVRFHNDYRVESFRQGRDDTTWTSDNPTLGRLRGNFAVIGDRIVSVHQTDGGVYQGTECLWRIDDEHYAGLGVLFRDRKRMSSWEVELVRKGT